MNIRDVVKNTDSFCGSRPADGATSYYSIRLCNLTPNGLFFPPCSTLTLTLPFPAAKCLKIYIKNLTFKNHLKTKMVVKWLYRAISIKKPNPTQFLLENTFLYDTLKYSKYKNS